VRCLVCCRRMSWDLVREEEGKEGRKGVSFLGRRLFGKGWKYDNLRLVVGNMILSCLALP